MSKKLVITGGAGFVGTNLTLHALTKDYSVTIYDTRDRLRRLQLCGLLEHERVTFYATDLAQDNFLFENDTHAIIHLAALAHVDYSLYQPEKVVTNNILSLVNVLQVAVAHKIPILYTSSVEVYGGNNGALFSEESPLYPLSPYAASKVSGEAIIQSYIASSDLIATTVRLTNLYGPWQAPDRLVPRIITQILCNHPCEITKDRFRDYVYITDATEALLGIVDQAHWGEVFNLSSELGSSNFAVATKIKELSSQPCHITTVDMKPKDGRGTSLVSSSQKLQSALAWSPSIALPRGIQLVFDWYSSHHEWWQQFETCIKSDRDKPEFMIDWIYDL